MAVAPIRRIPVSGLIDGVVLVLVLVVGYEFLLAPHLSNPARIYPAPRVTYATLTGPPFVLREHRGRIVFLDFWASWCEPCRLSLPLVERFARAHPDADVVAVNFGEARSVAARYAREHDLLNVALDPQTLSQGFFAVEGLPTMVVIDPQGRVRATWRGFNPAISLRMAAALKAL